MPPLAVAAPTYSNRPTRQCVLHAGQFTNASISTSVILMALPHVITPSGLSMSAGQGMTQELGGVSLAPSRIAAHCWRSSPANRSMATCGWRRLGVANCQGIGRCVRVGEPLARSRWPRRRGLGRKSRASLAPSFPIRRWRYSHRMPLKRPWTGQTPVRYLGYHLAWL
jgi:hypothetical protein